MRRFASMASWAFIVSLAMAFAGCGQPSTDVSVNGNVTYNGKPIPNGVLLFFPARGRAVPSTTDADGHYAAELAPGDYEVIVNIGVKLPPGWKEGDPVPKQEIVLPAEFTTRAKTPLKATVATSQQEPINFSLP